MLFKYECSMLAEVSWIIQHTSIMAHLTHCEQTQVFTLAVRKPIERVKYNWYRSNECSREYSLKKNRTMNLIQTSVFLSQIVEQALYCDIRRHILPVCILYMYGNGRPEQYALKLNRYISVRSFRYTDMSRLGSGQHIPFASTVLFGSIEFGWPIPFSVHSLEWCDCMAWECCTHARVYMSWIYARNKIPDIRIAFRIVIHGETYSKHEHVGHYKRTH